MEELGGLLLYAFFRFGDGLLYGAMAVGLAIALLFARPEGRNRYGAVPPVVPMHEAVLNTWRRSLDFQGRSGRSELWPWLLLTLAVLGVIAIVWRDNLASVAVIAVMLLLPGIAAGARRLHDINRSAVWLLIVLTGVGVLSLLILWAAPTQRIVDADVSDLF